MSCCERKAGPDVDAKSQMGAHAAERRRGMQVSAGR